MTTMTQLWTTSSESSSNRTSITSTDSIEDSSPFFEEILHEIRDEKLLFEDYHTLTKLDSEKVAKINQLKTKEEATILSIFISKTESSEEKTTLYRQLCGKLIATSLYGSLEEAEVCFKYVKAYAQSKEEKELAKTALWAAAKNLEATNPDLSKALEKQCFKYGQEIKNANH